MKNPKSNYIGDAKRIRRKRHITYGVISGVLALIVAFSIFFAYITRMKKNIDESFPSDTTTTEISEPGSSSEPLDPEITTEIVPDTTPESDPTSDTTADTEITPDPTDTETVPGDTGESTTGETTVNLLPDDWSDMEPVLFPTKYPLQTVTHAERDQSFANLKHAVKKYIEEHDEARISFCYINLNTNEYFGYNDVQPFVVGSCIDLPLVMMLYDDVRAGRVSLQTAMAYNSSYNVPGANSLIAQGPEGKQFFLDQLAYLALRDGDAVAMNMLFERMGGVSDTLDRLRTITPCIDFSAIQNYVDYKGIQQAGANRSSTYDLASYAEMLYWRYMSYPDTYQNLINALAASTGTSGVGKYFPTGTLVLHRPGSNIDFHCETDVAIILSDEPVVISVAVEADTPEAAQDIQAALGALVYNFISYCHA